MTLQFDRHRKPPNNLEQHQLSISFGFFPKDAVLRSVGMCSVVSKDADTQMAWRSGEGYLGMVVGIGIFVMVLFCCASLC